MPKTPKHDPIGVSFADAAVNLDDLEAQGYFAAVTHAASDLTGRVPHSAADFLAARIPSLLAGVER